MTISRALSPRPPRIALPFAAHAKYLRQRLLFACATLAVGCLAAVDSQASERPISVYSAAAVQEPITELAQQFERSTGHKIHFTFSTAGGTDNNIAAGAHADLIINARARLDALAARKLAIAPADLARVRIGIAVRAGGAKPDLATADSLRAALLAAHSVAAGEPTKGSTTGIHFATVLEQLGIAQQMQPKLRYAANGLEVMRMVARGDAELGITQISEIMHIAPATLVGPLPDALQLTTTYAIATGPHAASADASAVSAFTKLLLSEAGQARFRKAGFD